MQLILKFKFDASHSLEGHELPHSHLWELVATVSGRPIQGRIIDLVEFRSSVSNLVDVLKGTYLNTNRSASRDVQEFPTCEALCGHFYTEIHAVLEKLFIPHNPTLVLESTQIALFDAFNEEMGAARLLRSEL